MTSGGMPERLHHVLVEHAHAAGGDGAHGQLLVARHAQLAHEEDVERGAQRPGHLVGDRHAAARQRQHEHVRAAGVGGELLGQQPAGLGAVSECESA